MRYRSFIAGVLSLLVAAAPASASVPKWFYGAISDHIEDSTQRMAELESIIVDQAKIIADLEQFVSIDKSIPGRPAVLVTNASVQVINGVGSTETRNGAGNVIIGYDEQRQSGDEECSLSILEEGDCLTAGETFTLNHKSGSHNLVLGTENNYAFYGGIVGGKRNSISNVHSSVIGGSENVAAGRFSAVMGGYENLAAGDYAAAGGGSFNWANGDYSAAVGGERNIAAGLASVAVGGYRNVAGGLTSVAAGGTFNYAEGRSAVALGGSENVASGDYSVAAGGWLNASSGDNSVVAGGVGNVASGFVSTVTGGENNTASGVGSAVSGGANRTATGTDDWRAGSLFQNN